MTRLEFGKDINKDESTDLRRYGNEIENDIIEEDYESNQIRKSDYNKMNEIEEMKEFQMIENDILRNEIAPEIEEEDEDYVPVIIHKAQKRNSNSTYSSIITTSSTTSTSTPTPLCLNVYPQRATNVSNPQRVNNNSNLQRDNNVLNPQRVSNDPNPLRDNNVLNPQRANIVSNSQRVNISQSRGDMQPPVSAREL